MDNTKKPPTILSLCTGYGGIEKGLEKAIGKITPIAHVEIEAFADCNLVNKMETGKLVPVPIWTNIKTFRPYIFRDKVDILTGGYPCQPFSAAGKRKGKEDPRHLWPWIKEIIKTVRPGLCFFENVEGHISLGLREVLTDLVKLGYSVENDCGEPTWGLFSAAEVGAPHQRKRAFILAYSSDFRSRDIFGQIGCETGTEVLRQRDRSERSVRINSTGTGEKLDNTKLPGLEVRSRWRQNTRTTKASQPTSIFPSDRWPARPGEPQYEWEEPRVVNSESSERRGTLNENDQRRGIEKTGRSDGTNGQNSKIKPQLGRTIDGNRDRVDRLRLCGNGVVPATAEKAFITLMGRILNPGLSQPSIQLELF